MPVPCPCCKAVNDGGPACRRCKADLSLLFAVEEQRAALVETARALAAVARFADAVATLDRAAQLRRGEDVLRVRAAVLLLAGQYPAALAAYHELASR
jgi:hypothetical protein